MWHWSARSLCFPKQTVVKSQSCCSPLITATLTQQPGRLEPMLCWMGYYSQSEAIRGPATRAQHREFTGSQKQQPNRWPLEYWRRPHYECFLFFPPPQKWPKCRPLCLSELPPACSQTLGRLMAHTLSEIEDQTQALFQSVCQVTAFTMCWVLIARLIARLYHKTLQTLHSVLVQACGIASRQSGSDKPLTETWMLIYYCWKGMSSIILNKQ